jgi:glycosyltransferase involved in cell wall biosynthesis
VTVIVPARNEEGFIGACLDSVLSQDHPHLQVVVIDGASSDRTAQIVREYAKRDRRIELLRNPEALIPQSLNLGLAAARGRWLVRVDAHSTVPSGYVRTLVALLRTGRWGGVGGRKDGIGVTPAGRAIAAAMASPFGVGNSLYHHGTRVQPVDHIPFGAYPTALVRELGGWDERLFANEDFEFDYRLRRSGYQLLLDPGQSIGWRCRQSVGDLFRQYRRYGRGKADVARLHPDSLRLRHLMAPALIASWAGAAGLAFLWPKVALALLAPYAVAVATATVVTARRAGEPGTRRFLPGAFMAMHVGWGLGFWEGVLGLNRVFGRRRAR